MKFVKKFFALPELYCLLILIATVVVGLACRVTVENVTLFRGGVEEKISFPLLQKMGDGEHFQVDLDVIGGSPYGLKVIPDDCVENIVVGESSLNLNGISSLCDFGRGFVLPESLIAQNHDGAKAHYTFFLKNNGGPGGLNVFVLQSSLLSTIMKVLAILSFAVLCLLFARRLGFGWGLAFIVLLGVLIRTAFFSNIPYTSFANDVDGHVAYVNFILENHSIPGVDDCWTCYHPPVYYASAAPSFMIGDWMGVTGTTGLQAFSLLLSVLTLFFGIMFFRTFLSKSGLGIASFLWAFWPVMILMSPRIGNDQMFCMLHMLCLWGGANYLKGGHGKFLVVSVIAAALAMWTKMTAVVTLGMVFLFAVCGFVCNAKTLRPTKSEIVAWSLFVALVGGVVLQKLLGNADLVGNSSGLNGLLKVGNEASNYIFFDLKSFINNPYTSAWNGEWGREYFWNYSLKTAMFGEFELVRTQMGRTLATLMSVALLGLLVYAARGFWKTKLQVMHWILLMQTVAFFAALMFLRIKVPFSCSNDFRYIAPVVSSIVPFVAWGITLEGGSLKWKVLGYGLVLMFALSTVFLYILAV